MQYYARLINHISCQTHPGQFEGPADPTKAAEAALAKFGADHEVITIYPVNDMDRAWFDSKAAEAVLRKGPRMTVQRLRNLTGFFLQAEERANAEGLPPLAALCRSMANRFRARLNVMRTSQ